MKKILLFSFALSFVFYSCKGQEKKETNADQNDTAMVQTPQTKINVNREYDDDGNLIRFDSSYTYYYSNAESNPEMIDSMFNAFRNQFNLSFPFSNNNMFDNLFFNDSLLYDDFFMDDFFQKRFHHNQDHFDKYFKKMDSLKNNFYNRNQPNRTQQ